MTLPAQRCNRRHAMALASAWLGAVASPLAMAQSGVITNEIWQDTQRQRPVPVRIRWPQGVAPANGWPAVIYSHGLRDVVFALDEIARRKTIDKAWRFVRSDAVGMAGHSYGGHTTLGADGQTFPGHPGIKEPRMAALIALSPTRPARGDASQAYAAVTQPTPCITGTRDDDVLGNKATPARRAAVFDALPRGNWAMLLLKDADPMTFTGKTGRDAGVLPREAVTTQLQPQHHALTARMSTDWRRAHLVGESSTKNAPSAA